MAEEYEETKKNSIVPEVVDQKQDQLGIADEQAHEENQLELGKSGPLPRGIASFNADAPAVAAHEDDDEELGEQQQQEAPDQYPASSGIDGAQEAGTDFVPDVEPKHKLHSEDEPLPADGDYHDVRDDDDGGIAATGAGDDEEPSFEEATEAPSYGEEEKTAVPAAAADEQPSSQVTDGTDVAETPAAEEKPTETETETNPVVDDEEPRFDEETEATCYGEEEKTAVPAAAVDEQPSSQVTDGTDVAETPAAEEKSTETETETNPVVDDDKEPSFEEATEATSYGEEEKTAVPAAAADEQPSSQATDGTDVAETPAAEEKPAETETETNPVVDGDTPTPTTTPATPPTTNTTEEAEEPPKKEGFFSKFKDTVTFHHHHKSAETDEEGFFAKLKDKVTFHHHHPHKSVEEENKTSSAPDEDNVTPKEVISH